MISAERPSGRIWTFHRRALERGVVPVVPAAVLAQAWRGGPQPSLSRFLAGCDVEVLDEARARRAGGLCAMARTADVVDAAVVASAEARGGLILTTDVDDLQRLVDAAGAPLEVVLV